MLFWSGLSATFAMCAAYMRFRQLALNQLFQDGVHEKDFLP
jgi:hypothetical protein